MRLLQGMGKQLVLAVDLELEILAAVIGALVEEDVHQQRQRFLLDVAAGLEIDAEAVELVFAVAGAEPKRETALAQDVDEGGVLRHPQRIGERQRHHGGADLDPLGERGEVAGIDEHIRHDAVLIAEMMLGYPGVIEAQLVRAHDLARHPRVHVAVRIGLDIGVGMRCEQNSELHAPRSSLVLLPWKFDF